MLKSETVKTVNTVTELEHNFLTAMGSLMYAELGFSDVTLKDVCETANMPMKSAKGVLGSLIKKGHMGEDPTHNGRILILYLIGAAQHFANEWAEELRDAEVEKQIFEISNNSKTTEMKKDVKVKKAKTATVELSGVTPESLTAEMDVVTEIESRLFDTKKIQLHPNLEGFESPEAHGIYKTTGGKALGVVGRTFSPVDSKRLFKSLVTGLIENQIPLDKLKYSTLKGDSKILFSVPIKVMSFINAKGTEDATVLKLNLQSGYDGWTSTSLFITAWREICSNGMKCNVTEFKSTFKNVKGNVGKIETLTEDIVRVISKAETYEKLLNSFNELTLSDYQVNKFIERVFGMNKKDYSLWSTRKQNTWDSINRSVGLEIERTGQTLWGALNGVTHYTNHIASTSNREEYLLVDSGEYYNNRAQKYAGEIFARKSK